MGRTIEEKVIEKELSFAKLTVKISRIGEDYEITIQGGEKPHID